MKKTSKKKSKVVEAKPEVQKTAPEFIPGAVNVPFTEEELVNYSQLLGLFAADLQEKALAAGAENDAVAFNELSSRSQLSAILSRKLYAHFSMGEPPSRDVH